MKISDRTGKAVAKSGKQKYQLAVPRAGATVDRQCGVRPKEELQNGLP